MLESLMLLGIMTRADLTDGNSEATKSFLAEYQNMLMSTPAYAVITSVKNDRISQIEAGAAWLRLNLKTTELGLALHPVSQATGVSGNVALIPTLPSAARQRRRNRANAGAPGLRSDGRANSALAA